jgi:hypothetical protein
MVVKKFEFRRKKIQKSRVLVAHKTQTQHPIDKCFFVGKVSLRYRLFLPARQDRCPQTQYGYIYIYMVRADRHF